MAMLIPGNIVLVVRYKTFFMLNSAETKISTAHNC